MTPSEMKRVASRLEEFLSTMFLGLGRSERREALAAYLRGLLLDGERKSIEPIAARLVDDAGDVQAMRQRLQQAVVVASWDAGTVFRRVAERVQAGLPKIEALVVDDTGFAKKGYASVGVARQYSGSLGRVDNCQVATSLHLASEHGGACIGMRLYLPKGWSEDERQRQRGRIPSHVRFAEKWRTALALLDDAVSWGVPKHVVVSDAGYGDATEFRAGLVERGFQYVVGIAGIAVVWPPGVEPSPPAPKKAGTRGESD